ncbi:MAG: hypothetical protein LBG95_06965 [Treponema sp.]|jgi:hypothetical protein|nr:hypothetical protein [Treponema sp.]
MKKLFCIWVIALLWAGIAWGEDKEFYKIYDLLSSDVEEYARGVKDENGEEAFKKLNVYYFSGFDFEEYAAKDPDLTTLVNYAIDAIYNQKDDEAHKRVTRYDQKKTGKVGYSIIGHSQGGLRALGYVKKLKDAYPNKLNDIDAVITVSGIIQGASMLDGGLYEFRSKASRKVNTVANGLRAVSAASVDIGTIITAASVASGFPLTATAGGIIGGVLETVGTTALWLIPNDGTTQAMLLVLAFLPEKIRNYVAIAWFTAYERLLPQIRDMIPGSAYIKNNVVKKEELCKHKVKTGKQITVREWRYKMLGKMKVWYLWTGKVDEYKTCTEYKAVPQFDPDVPVGFIVGLDSNILNMSETAEEKEKARKGLKTAEATFGVAQGWHIAKCVGLIGLFTGSVTYASDADKARNLVANFNAVVAELIGSGESDGFVAAENQYIKGSYFNNIPSKKLTYLNRVLGEDKINGYKEMTKNTHNNIMKSTGTFKAAYDMIIEGKKLREEYDR